MSAYSITLDDTQAENIHFFYLNVQKDTPCFFYSVDFTILQ